MVVPVDLSDLEDIQLVVGSIQMFVKKKIPVRIGLVPTALSPGSISQLKVAQYLQETFGLSSMLQYFEEVRGNLLRRVCSMLIQLVCFEEDDLISGCSLLPDSHEGTQCSS